MEDLRQEEDLNVSQFCRMVGVSRSAYYRRRNGRQYEEGEMGVTPVLIPSFAHG